MPTPTKGPRLGGSPAHERLMLANLATSLFEHGRITTTETKAKRLRPLAEKLVTFAKRGDLHARRQVMTTIRDKDVVHRLFAEIGPRYENRPGGYTRITKVGPRKGDNAPMAVIELVEALTVGQQAVGEAERARGTRFASGAGAAAAAGEVTADAVETAEDASRPPRPQEVVADVFEPDGERQDDADVNPEPTAENGAVVDDPELSPEVAAAAAAEVEAAELGDAATAGDARPRRRGRARPEVTRPLRHDPQHARTSPPPAPVAGSSVSGWTISYDGTALHGWARQPGQRTVQGDAGAGAGDGAAQPRRPDRGRPHRRRRARHRSGRALRRPGRGSGPQQQDRLLRRLRGVLPPDIAVTAVAEAPARLRRPVRRAGPALRLPADRRAVRAAAAAPGRHRRLAAALDAEAMALAAGLLLGEHDFAAFCRRREGATTIRTLLALDVAPRTAT